MQTANEIRSAVDNIRYYSQRINELVRQQIELDVRLKDINAQVGSIRFDCLGAIDSGVALINVYCHGIEANLKVAVEQDRKLHIPDVPREEQSVLPTE